ncbi:MAG: hypothetical protein QM606_04585 [Leucobacter sp.]
MPILAAAAIVAFAFLGFDGVSTLSFDMGLRSGWGLLRHLIMPIVGFVSIAWLWTSLAPFTYVLGGAWLVVGVIIYLVRRTKQDGPLALQLDGVSTETMPAIPYQD